MCLHPSYIKNPNYKAPKKGLNVLKDCSSLYIPIPCGHCPQCIALRQLSIVQRVYMESINNYLFFSTLTYSNDALPTFEFNDFSIPYADFSDFQKMIKRIRKNNLFTRPFKYFVVSEFGKKFGRPHFHVIFSLPKYPSDNDYSAFDLENTLFHSLFLEWRRNYGTIRKPLYVPNFIFASKYVSGKLFKNFDLHYVVPNLSDSGVSSTAFYVSKYMLKPSDREKNLQSALKLNLSDEEFKFIWKDIKNIHVMSKGFGLYISGSKSIDPSIAEYINNSLSKSAIDGYTFPCFISPDSGKYIPLSRFYRHYFLTSDLAFSFYYNQSDQKYLDSIYETRCYDDSTFNEMMRQFDKSIFIVEEYDTDDLF